MILYIKMKFVCTDERIYRAERGVFLENSIVFDHNSLMEMIGHSSKGNQLKWKHEDKWYKADHMGYEGLSEVIISRLLQKSNVNNFVKYSKVEISYYDKTFHGCCSENFLSPTEELITVNKLYRQITGRELSKEVARIPELQDRIVFFMEVIGEMTGLKHFGEYITAELAIDAFFLNEDRHMNNIAVIHDTKTGEYRYCPYFDNGLSLFSDLLDDFPLTKSIVECRKTIKAKPFDRDFDLQLDAAEKLYGQGVRFSFGVNDVKDELEDFADVYETEILKRVEEVLRYQISKYQYLFV